MDKRVNDLWKNSLAKLEEGNKKFLSANISEGDISLALRMDTFLNGQKPYAVVISCSDSRVMPESIFSASIGDLFVIRVVGNVVDQTVISNMHFAVSQLNVPLVVVLGHTGCGAINSAINDNATGLIECTISKIKAVIGDEKDDYTASRMNVEAGVSVVKKVLEEQNCTAKVLGAMYYGDTGEVRFL